MLSPTNTPFYYSNRTTIFTGISDRALALAAPIIAFWSLSITFHLFDISGWKWLEQYRIHESSEVTSRNRASRSQVIFAVLLQQVIQTALGIFWMSADASGAEFSHTEKMEQIASTLTNVVQWSFGQRIAKIFLDSQGTASVYVLYWWAIPIAQFFFAMSVHFILTSYHIITFLNNH
jgi:sphinganine C4-monooxygenase